MSAWWFATASRMAGCTRASSRMVRMVCLLLLGRHHSIGVWRLTAPARACGAASADEGAVLEVGEGLLQLGGRVHHERPVLRDRLAERPAGDQQHAGRTRRRRGCLKG